MNPTTTQTYNNWIGRDAYDNNGDRIGTIIDIYYDDATGRPEWVAIQSGSGVTFGPIGGSSSRNDSGVEQLHLAYSKTMVDDAPHMDADGHLSVEDEKRLYSHYGFTWDDEGDDRGYGRNWEGARADRDYLSDDAMTRSEEQLRVGTERRETGTARLRKYVVTETQTVQVPVTREEVRIEREPITDANRGEALSGPDIAEAEHEVTLHAEVPVVTTETVAQERVKLATETVTDTETVTGEVRKEQIEVEGDTKDRR